MLVIGERINGMYSLVGKAITERDQDFIRDLALSQLKAGANALDISPGPGRGKQEEIMEWLVDTVSSVTDAVLCIDSPHPDVIAAGVKRSNNPTIINSLKKAPGHLEKLIPLAAEHKSRIICLLMDEKGIPADWNEKLEIAAEILALTAEGGIDQDMLYFDPILLPVGNAQKDVADTFALMDQLQMLTEPSPHMIVGLSNLSQQARYRSLLNRTYLAMAVSHGLDGVIADPLDEKLMKSLKTAGILMNRELYARSYLKGQEKN